LWAWAAPGFVGRLCGDDYKADFTDKNKQDVIRDPLIRKALSIVSNIHLAARSAAKRRYLYGNLCVIYDSY
jgi:hypothetical protein